MKISFENPDKINGLMTLTVEVDDYKEKVEKTLKDYRKKLSDKVAAADAAVNIRAKEI